MYQLYYYPNNASLAPHLLLHHMALDYQLLLVDRESNAHKSKDYLQLNPAGRIPTLIDDGQVIFETAAICIHLCEQHPEHKLIPELGSVERPLFFQWMAFLTNTLQAELLIRYYPHRHTTDQSSIAHIVEAQDVCIADALAIVNDALAGKQYLLGDQITACDYFLFMCAEWSLPVAQSPVTFEHLAKYLKRMTSLPTIQAVCQLEKIDLAPFQA